MHGQTRRSRCARLHLGTGRIVASLLAAGALVTACEPAAVDTEIETGEPPMARQVPKEIEKHGHVRVDEYYWLNERDNPDVVAYLEAENEYTDEAMAHTASFRETLFEEIKGRIKQTDLSVPYQDDGYFYYSRTEDGKEYPVYARMKGSLEAEESVMLDVNELADGHGFYSASGLRVSSNGDVLAFAEDTIGRRIYSVRFRNLDTGEFLDDEIPGTSGNTAWAEDNATLFYTKRDPQTLRAYQVFRHVLGTDPAADELVYEETDPEFSARVWKTRSKRFVMIGSSHTLTDEYRYVEAASPGGEFTVFLPREREHEHSLDHFGDHFYVRTNEGATNFRLMRTPVDATGKENWEEVIGHRDDVLLEGVMPFQDHLAVMERKDGLRQLRIRPWNGEAEHYLDFGEPAYMTYPSNNPDPNTTVLRYGFSSLKTPNSVFDYDMVTREKTLLKQEEVLGGYDPDEYVTERLSAPARDGQRIPVSLVYRKGTERNGENPLLLYGYGSYGASMDASFDSPRLSLIDRGFVYAIAHIRGGQELGRQWYEDGKLFNKKNTFNDFIDTAEFLIEEGFTNPEALFAMGGSAGGLLMGAVVNMRPDLWKGVVTRVPFVDVVTTMLDESIPLTTFEYDEWGDPNEKEYYDYILSYSPYDNVEAKGYPNMLVTTGLHDSQVQYWEPAKWVAKLRALKTDDNRLLLKTNMEAGHGGASGRYRRYEETAFNYAFILDLAGLGD
jgi:oligopeptidase B